MRWAPDAGAAGGALLIIVIIVIIVLKRRGGSGPAQPKPAKASKKDAIDSRNVVAFENPMCKSLAIMPVMIPAALCFYYLFLLLFFF